MNQMGDRWEQVAADWLQARGWSLLARNYRCKLGELDIVARDGDTVVFVEVRARSNLRYAGAAASVGPRKRRRLERSARHFLCRHPELADGPCRFDVIAFEPRKSAPGHRLNWIRGAFTA